MQNIDLGSGALGAIIPAALFWGHKLLMYLAARNRGETGIQRLKIEQEQSTIERLWERISNLEERIHHLEERNRVDVAKLTQKEIDCVRLQNKISDYEGVIAELEAEIESLKRPRAATAGA
jgi:chromosome segregation ATPase